MKQFRVNFTTILLLSMFCLILVGAGGLPTGIGLFDVVPANDLDTDFQWQKTQINQQTVAEIINNANCNLSESHKMACLNSFYSEAKKNHI